MLPSRWQDSAGPQDGLPDEPDEQVDFRTIIHVLRRRWAVIAGTFVVIVAITGLVLLQLTPRYTATAILILNTPKSNIVNIQEVAAGLAVDAGVIQSEADVLRSRSLAGRVADRLHLENDPELNGTPGKPSFLHRLNPLGWLPASWTDWRKPSGRPPAPQEAGETLQKKKTVDALLRGLGVDTDGRSYTVRVKFESTDPGKAALIANTFVDQYLVDQLEAKFEATRRASAWLNERLADLRDKVRQSDQAVQTYRAQANLIQTKGSTVSDQQLSELNTQLILARTDRAQADARLSQIRQLVKSDGIESSPDVLASALIQRLREQESDLLRKQAEMSNRYSDQHPVMVNAKAEIRDLRSKIQQEVNKIVQSIANQAQVAAAREQSLAASLQAVNSKVGSLSQAEIHLAELQREADANRTLFETFLTRTKETTGQDQIQQADARVISQAQPPDAPSFPKTSMMLGLSMSGSLVFGFMIALLIERLDNGFRSIEQVEQLTGLPGLGILPVLPRGAGTTKAATQEYALKKPNSAYAEAIQTTRTSLFYSDVDHPPKIVLVTSALPEEGKSTYCLSLARIAARSGQKVVLIDADLRRPKIAERLGLSSGRGLSAVLAGEVPLEKALLKDPESECVILTAHQGTAAPQDLLGSARMRDLLQALAKNSDLVIIDSPPIMAVSDAVILSKSADTTLFLVRWESTPRNVVIAGVRQFRQSGARLAGVVLTRVNMTRYSQYGQSATSYHYRRYRSYYTN